MNGMKHKDLEEIISKEPLIQRTCHRARLLVGEHPSIPIFASMALYSYLTYYFTPAHGDGTQFLNQNKEVGLVAMAFAGYMSSRFSLKKLYSQLVSKDKNNIVRLHNHSLAASLILPLLTSPTLLSSYRLSQEIGDKSVSIGDVGSVFMGLWMLSYFAVNLVTFFATPGMSRMLNTYFVDSPKADKEFKRTKDKTVYLKLAQKIKGYIRAEPYNESLYPKLAFVYLRAGHADEAFSVYSQIFERRSEYEKRLQFSDFWSPLMARLSRVLIFRPYNRISRENPSGKLADSIYNSLQSLCYERNTTAAVHEFQRTIKKFGATAELNTLYSILLKTIKHPDAEKQWASLVAQVVSDKTLLHETLGETVNKVYSIGPSGFLRSTFVFKESKSLGSLEGEYRMRGVLEDIVRREGFALPEILSAPTEYEIDGRKTNVYTMKRAPGKTLMEEIKETGIADLETVISIARLNGAIHAEIPLSESKNGQASLIRRLKGKLMAPALKAQIEQGGTDYRKIVRKIVKNYRPVYKAYKSSVFGLNLDSHLEQFTIAEGGRLTRLDTEDKGITPVQFDLVNLLEYAQIFSDEEKNAVISEYINSYNSHLAKKGTPDKQDAKILEMETLLPLYYNAVIERAISFCSAWSSPARRSLWPKRVEIIGAAITAIKRLEEKQLCGDYQVQYAGLKGGLEQLRTALNSLP